MVIDQLNSYGWYTDFINLNIFYSFWFSLWDHQKMSYMILHDITYMNFVNFYHKNITMYDVPFKFSFEIYMRRTGVLGWIDFQIEYFDEID